MSAHLKKKTQTDLPEDPVLVIGLQAKELVDTYKIDLTTISKDIESSCEIFVVTHLRKEVEKFILRNGEIRMIPMSDTRNFRTFHRDNLTKEKKRTCCRNPLLKEVGMIEIMLLRPSILVMVEEEMILIDGQHRFYEHLERKSDLIPFLVCDLKGVIKLEDFYWIKNLIPNNRDSEAQSDLDISVLTRWR